MPKTPRRHLSVKQQGIAFKKLKNSVLGKNYDLSVAFLKEREMLAVAKKYKNSNHAGNVLAFPLSPTSGEILICRAAAKPFSVEYLFIHALLHLKGLKHGCIMERAERELCAQFKYAKNSNRRRHRNAPDKSGGGRAQ